MSMMNWNEYRGQVAARVGEIAKASPGFIQGYQGLSGAHKKSGLLGDKVNELIALAVAVTRQCDGCIAVHTPAAIAAGASKEEIIEALSTAAAVNAGAAMVYSTRVLDAYASQNA